MASLDPHSLPPPGLVVEAVEGTALLSLMPAQFCIAGYVGSLILLTARYALFQTANSTAVIADLPPDRPGVVSGMLSLSRKATRDVARQLRTPADFGGSRLAVQVQARDGRASAQGGIGSGWATRLPGRSSSGRAAVSGLAVPR